MPWQKTITGQRRRGGSRFILLTLIALAVSLAGVAFLQRRGTIGRPIVPGWLVLILLSGTVGAILQVAWPTRHGSASLERRGGWLLPALLLLATACIWLAWNTPR